MKNEPQTYEEIIRKKGCIDLTKYYELAETDLEKIYDFLTQNPNGLVKGGIKNIVLLCDNNPSLNTVINTRCISSTIDGILFSNKEFKIIPHYVPSSGGSSGGGFSGGSSNNNNNNNNNNR